MKGKIKMKTYQAIIKMAVIVEANNENEAYEKAETWFREEPFPDYDVEINEISRLTNYILP